LRSDPGTGTGPIRSAGLCMADVIFVAVTVGVFGALALVARGVLKL
jgi:hypothetical protein